MSPNSERLAGVVFVLATITMVSSAWSEVISESKPFISPKGSYVTEEGAYHTFRIPGMVIAEDGSVLAFAEGRQGTGADPRTQDNAPIDLVMRRSTDNGKTWKKMVILDPGFKTSGAKVDFGDPTPVLDKTTGMLHLLYGQWPDKGPLTAVWGQDPDSAQEAIRSVRDRGVPINSSGPVTTRVGHSSIRCNSIRSRPPIPFWPG